MCFLPSQEHPYIFTKVNSFPIVSEKTEETVSVWLAAVLALVGLLVGCVVTGSVCYCTTKKNKKHKTTGF